MGCRRLLESGGEGRRKGGGGAAKGQAAALEADDLCSICMLLLLDLSPGMAWPCCLSGCGGPINTAAAKQLPGLI